MRGKNNMMNLCQCDRCKSVEEMVYMSFTKAYELPGNWIQTSTHGDMCEECAIEFVSWFYKTPLKPREKPVHLKNMSDDEVTEHMHEKIHEALQSLEYGK